MDIIGICAVALVGAILSVTVKKQNTEISLLISIAAGVVILATVLAAAVPAIEKVDKLADGAGLGSDYIKILFKTIGICVLCQFTADSCRDAGDSALAGKVEFAGKLVILLIALPLFEKISEIAVSLIGG